MSAVALSPDAPAIRLCHVVKWPDYEGFGFNLHSEKSKPGQYLGKIDEGSPAQLAGLREGDRIVEVNGINISNENHKQVVERIKAVPNETKLLVVDPLADAWYKEHKIIVKSSLPTVKQCQNPVPRPGKVALASAPSHPSLNDVGTWITLSYLARVEFTSGAHASDDGADLHESVEKNPAVFGIDATQASQKVPGDRVTAPSQGCLQASAGKMTVSMDIKLPKYRGPVFGSLAAYVQQVIVAVRTPDGAELEDERRRPGMDWEMRSPLAKVPEKLVDDARVHDICFKHGKSSDNPGSRCLFVGTVR
ncbi:hypothetical protein HPB51_007850 [Rhipicephalus microplus]|uniref:PDZ domain-containing protein n=1 Tax=Rhipicephalus microplus TaxID=6941 RepID=A0A9J6EMZ8_RHIMP|nr:hypothetical protein HPB51_007850 [Rhipicephalus microplus]